MWLNGYSLRIYAVCRIYVYAIQKIVDGDFCSMFRYYYFCFLLFFSINRQSERRQALCNILKITTTHKIVTILCIHIVCVRLFLLCSSHGVLIISTNNSQVDENEVLFSVYGFCIAILFIFLRFRFGKLINFHFDVYSGTYSIRR